MRGDVKLPAFYRIRALSELGNVTWFTLRKLLRECGVRRVRAGRKVLIPTAELATKVPLLYQGLQVVESARRRREERNRRS